MTLRPASLDQIDFTCIGHRGASGYAPENTLASFQLAIDMGCPWIELDVYQIEGQLLVLHDDTLERTTNGEGNIEQQSFAYLRSLDAGNGQQIPTLPEVIEQINHRAGINVELKGRDTAAAVVNLIHRYQNIGWSSDEFFISSFQHDQLQTVHNIDHALKLGALFSKPVVNLIGKAQALDAYSINIGLRMAEKPLIEQAHAAGLKVFVYTVNEVPDIVKTKMLGVDGVFTNYPDRVLQTDR